MAELLPFSKLMTN